MDTAARVLSMIPSDRAWGGCVSVSWNPCGRTVLVGYDSGRVAEWLPAESRVVRELGTLQRGRVWAWCHPRLADVWVVCDQDGPLLYDAEEQVTLKRGAAEEAVVVAAALNSMDDTLLVCYQRDGVLVYDIDTLKILARHPHLCASPVLHIVAHPRRAEVLVACKDRVLRSFRVGGRTDFGLRNKFLDPVNRPTWCSLGYSHDGELVYAGTVVWTVHGCVR